MNALADPPDGADAITDGSLICGHFRVIRKLGEGGMGEVYLAENANLPDIRCAIKVLRRDLSAIPRYAELLAAEAHRQARLEHENIVRLYDFVPWQQRYCLILAFVDGTTLAEMIDSTPGGLPEARALDLMLHVLEGLNYAHEHGVLHCDVKPPNVLVDREQRVRITDFGIARDVGLAGSAAQLGAAGTPEYMSPEQVTDPDQVDHRADVYAAGVLLFELLTGRLPFSHDRDGGGAQFPQLTETPADLKTYRADLSPALGRIVATALQFEPAKRFQGCLEFRRAITKYLWWRRWRRALLLGIVAVSVLVAGALGWLQHERKITEARAREAIAASIGTAIRQLGAICRESELLQIKRKALVTTVQAGGFPDSEATLRRQIDEIGKNLSNLGRGYADSVTQLAKFEPRWVGEAMAARPGGDAQAAPFAEAVHADHAALASGRAMRGTADLVAACPE